MKVPARIDRRFRGGMVAEDEVDARALEAELREALEGEVRFSKGDRALYSTGGSNYRQLPIGAVIPRSLDDVVATVTLAREFGAPVLSRGGGTSLAGQCCNVAVVIDFSKYLNRILHIDPDRRLARVQPGVILDDLREQAESRFQLTFGPDPSTHDHCTFGGMIGNNACGVRSVMAQFDGPGPRMSDNVHELDVLLYDGTRLTLGPKGEDEVAAVVGRGGREGELYARLLDLRDRYAPLIRERYPDIPRRVSGYNLDDLLPEQGFNLARAVVGSESTLVTVLEATVHLIHSPRVRALVALGFDDVFAAADHAPAVLRHRPTGLEGLDDILVQDMRAVGIHPEDAELLPEGAGWLIAELGGETREEADAKAHALIADLKDEIVAHRLFDDPEHERRLWEVREAGLGATAFIPGKPDTYEGWEDSAVPPERLGEYLRELRKLTGRYGYESALYGHFGQGCVHARWNFDLTSKLGIEKWRSFLDEAADLVVSLGGSISGEHGDGQSKAELLPKMFGDELIDAFREFKSIWDPDWKQNPGKVVDPYPITSNLRLGPDYAPPKVKTWFSYPDDGGSFAHAAVRCVGIGKCRRLKGGVMCPSFMVTREEKHTTRGRARLLFEMLNGSELELWRDEEVFGALDLCLACKGCTSDCPVSVDMPTLKAEFLAHYYEGKRRPVHAYAFGLVDQGARLASRAPRLANLVAPLGKRVIGVAPQRQLPELAPRTLQSWFHGRGGTRPGTGARLLLWPDTFSNYFEPEVGVAAVETLEALGFQVEMPSGHVCCGRPLYDYGMLERAKRYLERLVDELREEIRAGVPVVGIEPSCVAVFKDELPGMLPDDEDAKRLSRQTFHFAEFLRDQDLELPGLHAKAILHGHCHERATGGFEPARKLLEQMGLQLETPDSGCCGMAGAWGYEAGHYDVSVACGERVLFPAVRAAAAETLVVADGFSCRSQVEQGVGRKPLHLAQVIRLAAEAGPRGLGAYPERNAPAGPDSSGSSNRLLLAGGSALAAGAGLAVAWRRRR